MQYNHYLLNSKPYFIHFLFARLAELQAAGKDVISLVMGDPVIPTFPGVREATIKALENMPISQYPKTNGLPEYRAAWARWAKRNFAIDLDPDTEIISANGSKEAIFHLYFLFDWSNGKEIWLPSMAYPVYEGAARLQGLPVRHLPLSAAGNFLPDLEAFSDTDWQKCQILWLNSPHNPTTAIASKEYIARAIELAEKHDFLLVSDECYNELFYGDQPPASALAFNSQNVLVLRSLSKRSHMTGYRAAAQISRNKELIKLMTKMRAPVGAGTPDFIQMGAIAALDDDEHPRVFARQYKLRRDLLVAALASKGFETFGAEAGFYLWFSHPQVPDSDVIYEAFIDAGLLIAPGHSFGDDGGGYARMVYCITDEMTAEVARRIRQVKLPV